MSKKEKMKINLYDSLMTTKCFKNDLWSLTGAACTPKKVEWQYLGGIQDCAASPARAPEEETLITVFTDKDFLSPYVDSVESKYKIAFVNECRTVHPFAYEWAAQLQDKFDYIFTHDEDLLKLGPKYIKIEGVGTTWIEDDEAKMYDKTKLVSHIVSNKQWCRGHKLRHIVAEAIQGKFEVDLWGSAYKAFEDKRDPLREYCFSITIMNAKHENYFTETLVDTFRCGTIPIFWGCDNIGDYFDQRGVLSFNTGPELFNILNNLSVEKYYDMLDHAKTNYEIAKKYLNVDDRLAEGIMEVINAENDE